MTEPESSPTGNDHRLGHVQKSARERERNRLRAGLRVDHRCDDRRRPRVSAATGRCVVRRARLAVPVAGRGYVVVREISVVARPVGRLMTGVVGAMRVGVRLCRIRTTRECTGGQHPAGGEHD